jgi:predicted DNA-binding protein
MKGFSMSTTTIRIPDKLKTRVARAADHAGKTAHGFILEAIAEKTENAEHREKFHAEAEKRFAAVLASGKSISWNDMRTYVEKRVAGKKAKRPVARKLKS